MIGLTSDRPVDAVLAWTSETRVEGGTGMAIRIAQALALSLPSPTRHYANSLPWDDKGARLLTVANYEHYTELMDALRERVVRQRARFIEDYDDYIDQARLDLGKLFRIEDYPSKEDLQGKFAIRYCITPVPDADHFIAQLASDDTERVKRDIERHVEEQLHGAVGDLYRRIGEAVERVSERLREDDDGKPLVFRDTMISNIRDLVDVVPRLNIFGDETLARLCEQVKEKIAGVEAAAVLDAIGLTVSDAFRLMMVRIAAEKRLPFEPLVPNAETVAAMEAARRGDLITVGDVDGLMADLHAED